MFINLMRYKSDLQRYSKSNAFFLFERYSAEYNLIIVVIMANTFLMELITTSQGLKAYKTY